MRLIQNSNARETSRFSLRVELVKKKEKKRKVYSLKVDKRLDSKIRTSQLNHSCSTTLSSTRVWTGATDDRFTKSQRFHSFRKTILRGAAFFVEHGKIRRRRPFVSLSLSSDKTRRPRVVRYCGGTIGEGEKHYRLCHVDEHCACLSSRQA